MYAVSEKKREKKKYEFNSNERHIYDCVFCVTYKGKLAG